MGNGGELLVQTLVNLGATKSFGVPGESYLPVLDALYDTQGAFDFVLCRNEGGASFMASAYGKLTRTPGICFVTRGPGATNASIGVHTAMQDSSPMILFVGQIGTDLREREAFQEVDYRAVFGSMVKWVTEIEHTERVPELVARAWKVAISGRPGPVVVALPENTLNGSTDAVMPVASVRPLAEPAPDPTALADARAMLEAAKRPLMIVGGSMISEDSQRRLEHFAQSSNIPAIAAFRYQDCFDNHSSAFCGEAGVGMPPHVQQLIREADTILAVNVRFGEMTTNAYTLMDVPVPQQRLIHVHGAESELGKIYVPSIGIQAGPNAFAAALEPIKRNPTDWSREARARYEAFLDVPTQPSPVDMAAVIRHLRAVLPEDVILTNGAGNFTVWPNKFFPLGPKARLLAPQSGAMGYGVPAAIAAKVAHPGRRVVCFAGDGDFQMNCQELASAKQAGAQPIILILNNGIYGTIRAHQETHFPGRVSGTTMESPDFAKLAQSYGFHGERVSRTEDFAAAFERALASPTGAVLDLEIAAEAITPAKTLSQIRAENQR
ncbi:MAG: thiamine pyrophosphate-binding protein [Alphaproteobacteria bacterium TMED89]|nr:thiamine pyrophosphate-binding protein [Rhodospirillaceae bacterium]RPH16289.1 MAG: thiamine pyrophosphate-binding protein [Alphaproteobacteria bacterium TMED89]